LFLLLFPSSPCKFLKLEMLDFWFGGFRGCVFALDKDTGVGPDVVFFLLFQFPPHFCLCLISFGPSTPLPWPSPPSSLTEVPLDYRCALSRVSVPCGALDFPGLCVLSGICPVSLRPNPRFSPPSRDSTFCLSWKSFCLPYFWRRFFWTPPGVDPFEPPAKAVPPSIPSPLPFPHPSPPSEKFPLPFFFRRLPEFFPKIFPVRV